MKKLLTVLLALMLVFALSLSLVACGDGGDNDDSGNDGNNGDNGGNNGGNDDGNNGDNDGGNDAVVNMDLNGLLFVDKDCLYGMEFGEGTVKFVSAYDSEDDEIEELAYTVKGNVVTIDFNESQTGTYAIVDGKLILTTVENDEEYDTEFVPVGEYTVDDNTIAGVFTQDMNGATVTYTFADGKITMSVELAGETIMTQVMPYTISDGVITMYRVEEITVENDSFSYRGMVFKKTEFGLLLTHEEYVAADLDTAVTVEFFVQATQSWWSDEDQGKITVYGQDYDGGYFAYELACTEEDAAKLVPGTAIRVFGYKAAWAGEVEIMDCTFEFVDADPYIAGALDVTEYLGTDDLVNYQNMFVAFSGLTVVASQDADGEDVAFLYKWDGSGSRGDDIYFKVTDGENVYTFVLESYLTNSESDVYLAAEALEIGDVIDMEGFLYWYEGVQPHIVSITVAE